MVAKVSGLGQQCLFAYSGVRVPALHYRELRKGSLFYLIYLWPCQRLGVGRGMSGFGRTSTPTLGGGSYDSLPFCFSLIYLCARYIGADGRKVVAGIRHSRVILQGRRLPAPITYIGGCPTTGCSLFYFPVILHVHLDSFHHAPRLCSVDNRSLVLKIRMYDNLNHTARLIGMRIDINQHFAVGVFVDV